MAALRSRCGHYFCPVVSSFFPHLISAVGDWMSTILPRIVWPYCEFRMQVCNVMHTARWKYGTQKKLPKIHHLRTVVQLCWAIRSYLSILATKAHIDNWKKIVKHQYLLQMSSQYGELRPTSGWDLLASLGHPANFNGFRVLAALLDRTPAVGVSRTLWHLTEGSTYIWQVGHHVGHRPTF